MGKVSIETSQNVRINYTLAGISDRIFAFLIDSVIMVSAMVMLSIAVSVSGLAHTMHSLVFLLFLPFLFYHLLFEIFMNGQSPGKRGMDIRVVKTDGRQAGVGSYLLRWLLSPIDIYLMSGAIAVVCIVLGRKGQRLGDMAAGTTVVKVKNASVSLKNLAANQPQDGYEPIYPQAALLDPAHVALIQKAIDAKLHLLNEKPVVAIAEKTRAKLNVATRETDLKFLHTVLKDYHFLSSRNTG